MLNQNPEQIARAQIDQQLIACGWAIQHKSAINLAAATGVAVREYQTDKGIVIDECSRSIYSLWNQVLDYFDVFQIGLTARPANRTFGYFNKNIVSDYGYEKAVIDGVLVPYNVFSIETKITKQGGAIAMGEMVDKRERLTRRKFWEAVDEDIEYINIGNNRTGISKECNSYG